MYNVWVHYSYRYIHVVHQNNELLTIYNLIHILIRIYHDTTTEPFHLILMQVERRSLSKSEILHFPNWLSYSNEGNRILSPTTSTQLQICRALKRITLTECNRNISQWNFGSNPFHHQSYSPLLITNYLPKMCALKGPLQN